MYALGALEALSRTHPVLAKSVADTSRVLFAGHSRGLYCFVEKIFLLKRIFFDVLRILIAGRNAV